MKDEFLATLAHELRNPLAPIRNAIQVLCMIGPPDPQLKRMRDMIERHVTHMVRLVDDLLNVSRIREGKIELDRKRIGLASVVHDAVEMCRPAAKRANIKLTVSLPQKPIYLDADPVRLVEVLSNLLDNACKYTEPGGKIWLYAEQQGGNVVVRVKDTGVGIPPDKLSSVFEMFTQVERSLDRSQGGLGIGLTLVKRLVEMHDGHVEAHSEGPGKGSEFIVRLPLIAASPKAHQRPDRTVKPKTVGHRILIVDDNQDSADSLAMLLNITGNETHTAYDGLEAVEATERLRPDVILLDIGLPKLNGYEVCRRIREQSPDNEIVLVALTGWGQEEDRRRSKDAGFDDHLVKPVEFSALTNLLASLPPEPQRQQAKS